MQIASRTLLKRLAMCAADQRKLHPVSVFSDPEGVQSLEFEDWRDQHQGRN